MWEYTDIVREHFVNPQNAGELNNANAIGEVGSLACGDALKLYLNIDENGRIVDASFQTFGCASAIASSSVLTEMVKGLTVDEALSITNKDIAAKLGGLPKEKMHCSVMGQEALEAAIRHWRGEAPIPHTHEEGKLICRCFGITDAQIQRAIRENGLKTIEEVTHYTKAGGGCSDCLEQIEEILNVELGKPKLEELKPVPRMSNVQRMQAVMRVIDEEIRPKLAVDGGDIELVDMEGVKVFVRLGGRCSKCKSSQVTINNLVQQTLREFVDQDIIVQAIA